MIKFTKIILEDCFAFEYQEFEFDSGIHSINGINGASKTSIYLALTQGLFNKNPKGVRIDDVSNYVTKRPYQITIYFTKGSDEFKIVNSRKTGNISVEANGKSLSRKTIPQNLELIREILGDTYENFVGGSYQASDSTLDLLEESGDAGRKNFINKILKFDELDELLAHTKDKIKNLKAQLKQLEDKHGYLAGHFIPLKSEETLIPIDQLADGVEALERSRNNALIELSKLKTDKEAQESKILAYQKYQQSIRRIEEIEADLYDNHSDIPEDAANKELEDVSKELAKCEAAYKTAKANLSKLVEPEFVCSRCGHELDAVRAIEIYNQDKARFEEEMTTSTKSAIPLSLRKASLQTAVDKCRRRQSLLSERSMINNVMVRAEVADSSTSALASRKYDEAHKAYQSASQTHADALQELTAAIRHNDLVAMVKKLNHEAEVANATTKSKLNDIDKEIGAITTRIDLLDNWAKILGANGYRVHSMKKFLSVLNYTMDKYADIISGGRIKCTFFVTEEGKIEFSVVDPDKQVPFSNWSKGEQARVKLACLFSVIELLEVKGSASYNVLVLDEIFSALDDDGKEGLFDVLAYLRSKGKCIYTISHTPLVNPVVFDSTIEVVKTNGIAQIT